MGLLLLGSSSIWATIAMIAVLAAARPILKEANYTAYAAVMTPLVILLLDFGQAPSWAAVVDRLAATLAGCVLALTIGYLIWPGLSAPARGVVESQRGSTMDANWSVVRTTPGGISSSDRKRRPSEGRSRRC